MKFIVEERSLPYFESESVAESVQYKEIRHISILPHLQETEESSLARALESWRDIYQDSVVSVTKITEPAFRGDQFRINDIWQPYQVYDVEVTIEEQVHVVEIESLEALHQLSLRLDYPVIINYNDHSGKYPYPFLLMYDDYLE